MAKTLKKEEGDESEIASRAGQGRIAGQMKGMSVAGGCGGELRSGCLKEGRRREL
ncbi:MAG: hypothetical protein Q4B21_02795 [Bacteroidia bacterium]|nr:hypothetical protein [Bacteroidia bacterium]